MKKLKRIYLAGKVTDMNYITTQQRFQQAKQFLLSQGFDEVINPMEIIQKDTDWTEAMLILLPYLATCNYFAILPGYQTSNGALTEYYFALGMENQGLIKAIIHISY